MIVVIELFVVLAGLLLFGAIFIGMLKLLVWLIILPIKLGFWIFKGIFALFLLVPVLLIAAWAISNVVPFLFLVVAVPLFCLAAGAVALLKFIF